MNENKRSGTSPAEDLGFEKVEHTDMQLACVKQVLQQISDIGLMVPKALKELDAVNDFALQEGQKVETEAVRTKAEELKHQYDELQGKYRKVKESLEEERKKSFKAEQSFKNQVDKLTKEKSALKFESQKQLDDLRKQLLDAKCELKKVNTELSDTKNRLSRFMGYALSDANPDIADLSDQYRPTKIAERYQELYDNQWTDAFETIDNIYKSETKAIKKLLEMLKDITQHCQSYAHRQMVQVKKALTLSPFDEQLRDFPKQVKDLRKMYAVQAGESLCKDYMEELKDRSARTVPTFIKECYQICWMMAVQDPPMVFSPDVSIGDKFNADMFKAYTANGDTVLYLVWPAMLLHEGGSVISKGIVQCKGVSRPKSAPSVLSAIKMDTTTTTDDKTHSDRNKSDDQHGGKYPFVNTDNMQDISPSKPSYEQTVVRTGGSKMPKDQDSNGHSGRPSQKNINDYMTFVDVHGKEYAKKALGDKLYKRCAQYVLENFGPVDNKHH